MLFYGTYIGDVVYKLAIESSCSMANVGSSFYVIFRETL